MRGIVPLQEYLQSLVISMTNKRTRNFAFLFILPGLLGFGTFYIWPFLRSMGYALTSRQSGAFVGLTNFADLIGNQAYTLGLTNTLFFMGVSVPLGMALSLFIAMAVNKLKRGKAIVTLICLIPLVIPSGSTAFFWQSLFAVNGHLNGVLSTLGFATVKWTETAAVRFVVILIFLWKNMGYNMVLFLAGLNNIPKEYYEAARIDGAGRRVVFTDITLACLWPTMVLTAIMSVVNSFKVFKEIYMLTGNYPHESIYTLQHFMNNMFSSLNYARLTAAMALLVLGIGFVTLLLLWLERRAAA